MFCLAPFEALYVSAEITKQYSKRKGYIVFMKCNQIIKFVLRLIQGVMVGASAIIPGFSGGVLCVSFGIYEAIMGLFSHPVISFKKHFGLFIPFIIGWGVGFISSANTVGAFITSPITLMLFFGLICGTLPELMKNSEIRDPGKSWTPFVLTLAFVYCFFDFLESVEFTVIPPSFLSYILCGFLYGFSLIAPGFDSLSILHCFGLYQPMAVGLGALDFSVLLPVLIGLAITVALFARLVTVLFEKSYALTMRIVLGVVVAIAVKKIVPSYSDFAGRPIILLISIAAFALGFVLSRAMDKMMKS